MRWRALNHKFNQAILFKMYASALLAMLEKTKCFHCFSDIIKMFISYSWEITLSYSLCLSLCDFFVLSYFQSLPHFCFCGVFCHNFRFWCYLYSFIDNMCCLHNIFLYTVRSNIKLFLLFISFIFWGLSPNIAFYILCNIDLVQKS